MKKGKSKRECEVCGLSLEGKHKHARYCSNKCRVKAHRMRDAETLQIVLPKTLDTEAESAGSPPQNNVLSSVHSYFVLSN